MASQEFQYIQDILKEWYAPAIVNQVYKKSILWTLIQKRVASVPAGGKYIIIPVRVSLTEAVGPRIANTYTLPTAQKVGYDSAKLYLKRNYGRIKVDGFAIESAKGKGGWIDVMTGETQGVADAFAIEIDQQLMGRGTGELGHVASVSGATITVDNPHGITDATPGFNWFRAGMVLDGHDVDDDGKDMNSLQISSISGQVLTMTASTGIASLADGDWLSREDSVSMSTAAAAESTSGAMMGIDGIIDSGNPAGNFQNINRTTVATWQAYEGTSTGILTETKIQEGLDAIEKRTDANAPNIALTTYALRNKLIEIVKADRMISTLNLRAGWQGIRYRGGNVDLPIVTHKFAPRQTIYFISLPHLKFYTLKKLVWDNKGGGIVKPVAGEDAYESWFKMYGNLGTDCSNAHGKLTGVTTS